MGLEKEAKLRIKHKEFLELAEKLGLDLRFDRTVSQRDEFFDYEDMHLMRRDSVLRIRREDDLLIVAYKGPRRITNGIKVREEVEGPIGSEECLKALRAAGVPADRVSSIEDLYELLYSRGLSKKAEVRKKRKIYKSSRFNCEICLDSVDGLGEFVEIEGKAVERFMEEMGIDNKNKRVIKKSYLELIAEKGFNA